MRSGRALLRQARRRIDPQALLVVDSTDIVKPYAKAMPCLARVRDGSTGQLRNGYWCCTVVAAWRGRAEVVPLYQELYSQRAPDFESENRQILQAIERLRAAVGTQGTWVMDRGGDRRELLHPCCGSGSPS